MRSLAGLAAFSPGFEPEAPAGPPPFDLATLNLSFRVQCGFGMHSFPSPAGAGAGAFLWQGSPSAGASGGNDAYLAGGPHADYLTGSPLLNGNPTLNFSTAAGTRQLNVSPADADARAGLGPIETAYPDCFAAGLFSSPAGVDTGSMWALVNIAAIAGGSGDSFDSSIFSARLAAQILAGGAGNDKIEFGRGFNHLTQVAAIVGSWVLIQVRFGGGQQYVRLNGGAWSSLAAGSQAGQILSVGISVAGSANFFGADFAASPDFFSDATFDNVYAGIQALYPGAGLPP